MSKDDNTGVEDNTQSNPSDETKLIDQAFEDEGGGGNQDNPDNDGKPDDKGAQPPKEDAEPNEGDKPPEDKDDGKPSDDTKQDQGQREIKRSTRAERRFDQLTKKLAEQSKQAQVQPSQLLPDDQVPKLEPGKEYTAEELQDIVTKTAQAVSRADNAQMMSGLQASQTANAYVSNLTEDTASLRSKYDALNPESDSYDEKLEALLVDMYTRANPLTVDDQLNPKVDPEYRLRDAAEQFFETLERYQQKGQTNAKNELHAAADGAVLQPTGGKGKSIDNDLFMKGFDSEE